MYNCVGHTDNLHKFGIFYVIMSQRRLFLVSRPIEEFFPSRSLSLTNDNCIFEPCVYLYTNYTVPNFSQWMSFLRSLIRFFLIVSTLQFSLHPWPPIAEA